MKFLQKIHYNQLENVSTLIVSPAQLEQVIDVAFKIEKYVQILLHSTNND